MATKTYDPKNVTVLIGAHIASGFADGTFINASRNNQMWTVQSGASGETARSKSGDLSGTIELTFMQTSETNDILSGYAIADESNFSNGTFPITITDGNGATLLSGLQSWIQKQPDVELGKDLSERTWTIETGELLMNVGGTAPASNPDALAQAPSN